MIIHSLVGLKLCYRGKDLSEDELYNLSEIPRRPRRRQDQLLSYMFKLSTRDKWADNTVVRPGLRSEHKIKLKLKSGIGWVIGISEVRISLPSNSTYQE